LEPPLPASKVALLDKLYKCSSSGNCEILASYFSLALRAKYEDSYPKVAQFITRQGMMGNEGASYCISCSWPGVLKE
jgi:hypothetical protein